MKPAISENDINLYIEWMKENHPNLSDAKRDQLLRYGRLVAEGSGRMGLIARGDVPRLHMRHLRESLAPALLERIPQGASVVDVGSGAGLPGIPIAILRDDVKMMLVEPRERRVAFLDRTIMSLGLGNTTSYGGSVDAFAGERAGFDADVVVSRGLAWTEAMVDRLLEILGEQGVVIRFGTADPQGPEVEVAPIEAAAPRGIQVWPRCALRGLPGAR